MRVRTAKQRAQRIDLNYFKQVRGLPRWRMLLSLALPVAALAWVAVVAASGNRSAFSPGPVSTAHAFAERRCEVCHTGGRDPRVAPDARPFRAHTTDAACVTCHDAPAHAINQTPPPACATCHQDHRGRVKLATTDDGFCVECHGGLKTTQGPATVALAVHGFPGGHPEFAAVKAQDPARLRFNHAVHVKDSLRGPLGAEKLECATCHKPEAGRGGAGARGPATTGVMAPVIYEQHCARCHPLFFDERIEQAAPHAEPVKVRAFVRQALAGYIREHPGDMSKPDSALRRVPLNFPRPHVAGRGWSAGVRADQRHGALDAARRFQPHAPPDGDVPELPCGGGEHGDRGCAAPGPGGLRHMPCPLERRAGPLRRVPSVSRLEKEPPGHARVFADGFQVRHVSRSCSVL
jgi:hypothetical protein